jgi:hypothetical protein
LTDFFQWFHLPWILIISKLTSIAFQDIKATHVAVEAPFQILLKVTMISMGILPLPGYIDMVVVWLN